MNKAISLFSSAGIGDLALRNNNIETVIANEIIEYRANQFKINYPKAKVFCGDIIDKKGDIIDFYKNNYKDELFLLLATPPCQGMSSNGMGKLLNEYRAGRRDKFDKRNQLIIPAIEIAIELKPKWIIFENVPNMKDTIILDKKDNPINIIEYIKNKLGNEYVGRCEVVDTANYGVPQHRKRLISIFSKDNNAKKYFNENLSFLPERKNEYITLFDAIGHLPFLDGAKGRNKNSNFNILHEVPILDDKKYTWISNTKEGDTAFNNQCINCSKDNKKHGASVNDDGINKFKEDTPLYCENCGELLPRPYTIDKETGKKRLMKGYVSAYKRMEWNKAASTLTQNFQYPSSDNNIHPSQNRVLSIYEALIIQGINDYNYKFCDEKGKIIAKSKIREIIGESVSPKLLDLIMKNIVKISVDK